LESFVARVLGLEVQDFDASAGEGGAHA